MGRWGPVEIDRLELAALRGLMSVTVKHSEVLVTGAENRMHAPNHFSSIAAWKLPTAQTTGATLAHLRSHQVAVLVRMFLATPQASMMVG